MRAVLMFAVLAVAVPDRPDPTPKKAPLPKEQIVGAWQDQNNRTLMLRIRPAESEFLINGNPSPHDGLTANIVIDWTKNPATIDFQPKQRGGVMLGILKLEGDQLTINLRTSGNTRPTNFGAGDLLLHYQRVRR